MSQGLTVREEFQSSENSKRSSFLSNMTSRQVFLEQENKKKRFHNNLMYSQLKLSRKITHEDQLEKQQHKLDSLEKLRKTSLKLLKKPPMITEFTMATFSEQSALRISRFADEKSQFQGSQNLCKINGLEENKSVFLMDNKQPQLKDTTSIEEKSRNYTQRKIDLVLNKKKLISVNKIRKKNVNSLKPGHLLSEINNKIREIDVISKTFDQVNESYNINFSFTLENHQPQKKQKKGPPLQNFQPRSNLITLRKSNFKKTAIFPNGLKTPLTKRYKTQADHQEEEKKYSGLWYEDAKKLKNYISGGYPLEKEEYSDYCDLEEYRRLKKNFRSFDQICTSIKEDKDKPIGKMFKTNGKNPSILEVVCNMQRLQEMPDSETRRSPI